MSPLIDPLLRRLLIALWETQLQCPLCWQQDRHHEGCALADLWPPLPETPGQWQRLPVPIVLIGAGQIR
jgi:hypothetical protein